MRCIVMWGISPAVISSLHNVIHPPDSGERSSEDEMWLPLIYIYIKVIHAVFLLYGIHLSMNICIYRVNYRVLAGQRYCNNSSNSQRLLNFRPVWTPEETDNKSDYNSEAMENSGEVNDRLYFEQLQEPRVVMYVTPDQP